MDAQHRTRSLFAVLVLIGLAAAQDPNFQPVWNVTIFNSSTLEGGTWRNPPMVATTADKVLALTSVGNNTYAFQPRNFTVSCHDAMTGAQLWTRQLDANADVFWVPPHIVTSADGSTVFVSLACYTLPNCGLYALDVNTSDILWFHANAMDSITPAPDGAFLIVASQQSVSALAVRTGTKKWSWTPASGVLHARPPVQAEGYGWLVRTQGDQWTQKITLVNGKGLVAEFNVSALGCYPMMMPAARKNLIAFVCRENNGTQGSSSNQGRSLAVSLQIVTNRNGATQLVANWALPFEWETPNFANGYGGAAITHDQSTVFIMTMGGLAALAASTGQQLGTREASFGPATNMYGPVFCENLHTVFYDVTGGYINAVDVSNPTNLQSTTLSALTTAVRPPACGLGASQDSVFAVAPGGYPINTVLLFKLRLVPPPPPFS